MQEKTEKPSSHKLKKAKERGEISYSSEFVSAVALLGALLLIWVFATQFEKSFKEMFSSTYDSLNVLDPIQGLQKAFAPLIFPTLVIMMGVLVIALLAHFLHAGFNFSWKRPQQKEGFRWFYVSLKLVLIALITYFSLRKVTVSETLFFAPSSEKTHFLFKKLFFLSLKIAIALLFLSICDIFYQKWKYNKRMQMSRQELKEEMRETEGDQQTKSRMRFRD